MLKAVTVEFVSRATSVELSGDSARPPCRGDRNDALLHSTAPFDTFSAMSGCAGSLLPLTGGVVAAAATGTAAAARFADPLPDGFAAAPCDGEDTAATLVPDPGRSAEEVAESAPE